MQKTILARICALGVVPLFTACSGLVVHDAARAKLAGDANQQYQDVKIVDSVAAERKNLEVLLAAETEAVRENFRYQSDYALLRIANNTTPMAESWVEVLERVADLGYGSLKELRTLETGQARLDGAERQLATARKVLVALDVTLPACAEDLPAEPGVPAGSSESVARTAKAAYALYVKACKALIAAPTFKDGELKRAYDEWRASKDALDDANEATRVAAKQLVEAKQAYDAAFKSASDPRTRTDKALADVKEKADQLASALKKAQDKSKALQTEERIDALVQLLTAAAGGQASTNDPALKRAVMVVQGIPSIAADAADMEATRKAPPVSGLLLALRQQTILADSAQKKAALAAERVQILRARYDAYREQAGHWRAFLDAMCSYAVQAAKKVHPGAGCDDFRVELDANKKPEACSYKGESLKDCLLMQPWKVRVRANEESVPGLPPRKRELYKAIAAYLQGLALQGLPIEQRYREIDVRQRETLLAKQTALESWDNLVAVPLGQLDGYYHAGIKPAEVADLLVKAIGFTAVAVGVAAR